MGFGDHAAADAIVVDVEVEVAVKGAIEGAIKGEVETHVPGAVAPCPAAAYASSS